jgi:hypothetical protein
MLAKAKKVSDELYAMSKRTINSMRPRDFRMNETLFLASLHTNMEKVCTSIKELEDDYRTKELQQLNLQERQEIKRVDDYYDNVCEVMDQMNILLFDVANKLNNDSE